MSAEEALNRLRAFLGEDPGGPPRPVGKEHCYLCGNYAVPFGYPIVRLENGGISRRPVCNRCLQASRLGEMARLRRDCAAILQRGAEMEREKSQVVRERAYVMRILDMLAELIVQEWGKLGGHLAERFTSWEEAKGRGGAAPQRASRLVDHYIKLYQERREPGWVWSVPHPERRKRRPWVA